MAVQYRSLNESEIPEAAGVFLTTLADLAQRKGLSPPTFQRPFVEKAYAHLLSTGIFRVAELDGRVAAICAAVVRGNQWFLSMFWTLPEFQKQGIGGPLLRDVWEEGRRRGAGVDATWSSIDYTAVASYLRLGMLPGGPILSFAGALARTPEPAPGFELEALEPEVASHIDAEIRGCTRDVDHAFWSGQEAFQVRADGALAGYFYAHNGVVGPVAWRAPEHGRDVIALALRKAAEQAAEVRLMAIGENTTAIRTALDHGLRLAGATHFLRSAPFGKMDRYLPSGPILF